jgi:hypothetical protein
MSVAKKKAVERMAQGVARVADDWGWRGGKPKEITGTEYHKQLDDLYYRYNHGNPVDRDRWAVAEDRLRDNLDVQIENQISRSKNSKLKKAFFSSNASIDKFATDMKELEQAGVPREWTGRLWPALQEQLQEPYDMISPTIARQVSAVMRSMSNNERDVFVTMLPRWSGTMEDLASTAKRMARAERMR